MITSHPLLEVVEKRFRLMLVLKADDRVINCISGRTPYLRLELAEPGCRLLE
jgi:hypothetical protein